MDEQRDRAATKDGQDFFNMDKQDGQDKTQSSGWPERSPGAGFILSILFIHVKNLPSLIPFTKLH
jgi:hypothetical protein